MLKINPIHHQQQKMVTPTTTMSTIRLQKVTQNAIRPAPRNPLMIGWFPKNKQIKIEMHIQSKYEKRSKQKNKIEITSPSKLNVMKSTMHARTEH